MYSFRRFWQLKKMDLALEGAVFESDERPREQKLIPSGNPYGPALRITRINLDTGETITIDPRKVKTFWEHYWVR